MGPWFYWGIATIIEQENLGLKMETVYNLNG